MTHPACEHVQNMLPKTKGRDASNVPRPLDITEPVIGGPKMPVNGNMAILPNYSTYILTA